MPNPNNFSDQESWMQACVPQVMGEGKDQCSAMWNNKNPQRKSKIEILSGIKKLIEKNGYSISDEKIIEMFGVIETNRNSRMYTLSVKLDSEKNQVIKIFPKKKIYIEKYDEYVDFNDFLFDKMIENFSNPKLFKPFMDEQHELGKKFADIKKLIKRDDGLYAAIELNESGVTAIKNEEYSYISPEWGDRTDTEGNKHEAVLWAVTLTNIPALEGELPKLQDQMRLSQRGGKMDLTKKLTLLEGRLSNYKLQGEDEMMIPPEMMEAIGMLKDAVAKIDELTQQKDVAEEEAMKFKKLLDQEKQEKLEKEKEEFFKAAVENGQVEPGELEDWQAQYDKSKDFVVKMLTSRPKKESHKLTAMTQIPGGDKKLTKEDRYIGEQAGYDMDDPKSVKQYYKDIGDIKIHRSTVEEG